MVINSRLYNTIDKTPNIYDALCMQTVQEVNNMTKQLQETVNSICTPELIQLQRRFYKLYTPELQQLQKHISELSRDICNSYKNSVADVLSNIDIAAISSISKLYKTTFLSSSYSAFADVIQSMSELNRKLSISETLVEAINHINFDAICINKHGETIEVDGDILNVEEEAALCRHDISQVKDAASFDIFIKKHKIIYFILTFFIVPFISEFIMECGKNYCEENKYAIVSCLSKADQIGVVSVEKAAIRLENNSHSTIVGTALYGDELIIIGKVRYWYKVKFKSDNNDVLEGYIAIKNIDY